MIDWVPTFSEEEHPIYWARKIIMQRSALLNETWNIIYTDKWTIITMQEMHYSLIPIIQYLNSFIAF